MLIIKARAFMFITKGRDKQKNTCNGMKGRIWEERREGNKALQLIITSKEEKEHHHQHLREEGKGDQGTPPKNLVSFMIGTDLIASPYIKTGRWNCWLPPMPCWIWNDHHSWDHCSKTGMVWVDSNLWNVTYIGQRDSLFIVKWLKDVEKISVHCRICPKH